MAKIEETLEALWVASQAAAVRRVKAGSRVSEGSGDALAPQCVVQSRWTGWAVWKRGCTC
jgi:hypothetical protein